MDNSQTTKNSLNHVAIIMDGNGRWAKKNNLSNDEGHKKGAESAKEAIKYCLENNIKYLTLYAFSYENWNRSPEEIEYLMNLLKKELGKEIKGLIKNGVNLRVIGEKKLLKEDLRKDIDKAEKLTRKNNQLYLSIALSYGSRQEIVGSVKKIASRVQSGDLKVEDIDENLFGNFLYTQDIPDPDIMIRTSGEKRVSNFLLWQICYTELFFLDVLWPDFTSDDFTSVVEEYAIRDRRYGK